jgi:ribosomal protein S18 acetylase RimI-like enzyme
MEIRPAVPEDVPAVLPMVQNLADLHQAWDPERYAYLAEIGQRYRSWLTQRAADPRSVFFVAEAESGKLAGFCVATVEGEIPIYRVSEVGFVHDMWVEEAYRHEGVGRQMTMRLIERFREIGVRQIRLETAEANEAARGLFASCGFRVVTREMMYSISESSR